MFKPFAAVVLLGLAGVQAAGAVTNAGQVFVTPNFSGGTGPFQQNLSGTVIDISGAATGGASSSGSATLHVAPGVIKMGGNASGSLNTVVRGIIHDTLTIDVTGVAPGSASVSYPLQLLLTGLLNVNDAGLNKAGWSVSVFYSKLTADISAGGSLAGGGAFAPSHGYTGDPLATLSKGVTVPVGVPMALTIELDGSAQASYSFDGGVSTAAFDLTHSLYWGGVDHLTMNGQAITDFKVTSESGADYRHSFAPAVPEPAGLPMMLAGLAALGAVLRRGRHSSGNPT